MDSNDQYKDISGECRISPNSSLLLSIWQSYKQHSCYILHYIYLLKYVTVCLRNVTYRACNSGCFIKREIFQGERIKAILSLTLERLHISTSQLL